MTTRERVLALLENDRGSYFSGEKIAEELDISRTAVWKAVKTLENEGYPIEAVTNKGYCLKERTDVVSVWGIEKYLNSDLKGLNITVMEKTASTNNTAKEKAAKEEKEGFVVIAKEQTMGKGRLGRTFFSPRNTGFYMSLLLRPKNYTAKQAVKITTMAAVAVCRAIEKVSDKKAEIKWVNDIFIDGKKVCGISTEGSFNMENALLEYAVLGIGVNVYQPEDGFPMELKSIAGSIFSESEPDAKNKLCAEFLNSFFDLYYDENSDYAEEYKKRCFVIGKEVSVIKGDEKKSAFVTGINDECQLLVKYDDGKEDTLLSGEISIRF